MAFENLLTEVRGRVGLITLHRPKALKTVGPTLLGDWHLGYWSVLNRAESGCDNEYWPTCADEYWPTLRGLMCYAGPDRA